MLHILVQEVGAHRLIGLDSYNYPRIHYVSALVFLQAERKSLNMLSTNCSLNSYTEKYNPFDIDIRAQCTHLYLFVESKRSKRTDYTTDLRKTIPGSRRLQGKYVK